MTWSFQDLVWTILCGILNFSPIFNIFVENLKAPCDSNIFLIGCTIICHVFPFIICFFIDHKIHSVFTFCRERAFISLRIISQLSHKILHLAPKKFISCYNIILLNVLLYAELVKKKQKKYTFFITGGMLKTLLINN